MGASDLIDDFYSFQPYELEAEKKEGLLLRELTELTKFHQEHCRAYANFLEMTGYDPAKVQALYQIPFFPVRLFKEYDLISIDRKNLFKTMTSSGTTGQKVSKIFLDKETAMAQQKVMIRILSDFWGKKRLPMLIIDTPDVLKDRAKFSARGAAIMGLSFVARESVYALREDMSLDLDKVRAFAEKYAGQRFIIFGFTFLVWQHFYQELCRTAQRFDFSQGFLMTGGGWKKLMGQAVSQAEFKRRIHEACGIRHFLDHYGMVEQTGAIYAECEYGHLHASIFSDVLIRNYRDFSLCPIGQKGIIQVVSALPRSYPGHSLLTEDEGVILGEDDCPCGRKGKYIQVLGRMAQAELRGCSDTYAEEHGRDPGRAVSSR